MVRTTVPVAFTFPELPRIEIVYVPVGVPDWFWPVDELVLLPHAVRLKHTASRGNSHSI